MLERLRLRRESGPILSQDEFRRVLERERSLADRHDLSFCLLVFSRNGSGFSASALASLAEQLSPQLRSTDVAGWMERGRIAAILPHTSPEGARQVGERVIRRLPATLPRPAIEVWSYPEADETADRGNPPSDDFPGHPPCVPPPRPRTLVAATPPTGRIAACSALPPSRIDELLASPFPAWKHAADVVIATALLVTLSPLMLGIALLIKLVSPGPVLFKQERVGYLRRTFPCWKFRTMHLQADTHVHETYFQGLMATDRVMKKLDCRVDPRVIPFGRFLRASGLDELPQLFNVLRGEMSFIGPRPCIEYEFVRYKRWQKRRCDTRPGLTGLWQVSGKNRTTFSQMMRLDISYARHRTPWRDFWIVLRTVPAVVNEVCDTFGFGRARVP